MSGRIWAMPVAPVTGDADRVVVMAQRFGSTAETIRAAARSLRALDDGGSSSDAVDAFMAKAVVLAAQMARAEGRYEVAGDALSAYARVLAVAQESSARAVRDHRGATDDHDVQHRQAERFRGQAMLEPEGESKRWLEDQARLHQSRSDDARTRVAALGRVIDEAHAEVAAAAALAISRLDGASGDGLRDSVFDDIGGAVDAAYEGFQVWMEDNDAWITDVVDALGTIGFALMFIAPLVPGVNVLVAVAAALVLVAVTAKAVAGTGTWGEVAIALFSVVAFGAGAVLSKGATQGVNALKGSRVSQLRASGVDAPLANTWVNRMWARAEPGSMNSSLIRAAGDPFVAQVSRFIRPSKAPGITDDPVVVAAITSKLQRMRAWQVADVGVVTADRFGVLDSLKRGPRTRFVEGGAW
jgi:hypothetical protein